jgi:DNA-directed RNA polymerase subunit RPC12/RpoP
LKAGIEGDMLAVVLDRKENTEMNPILFYCPRCSRSLQIEAVHAGAQVACPQCGEHVTVPMVAVPPSGGDADAKRPTSITVFGILNIIFGSLGLMCVPFNIYGLSMAAQAGRQFAVMPMDWQIISAMVSPFTAIWLIVTGIGLLNLKRWARGWAIGYGCFSMILGMVNIGMVVSYAIPGIQALSSSSSPEHTGRVIGTLVGGVFGGLAMIVYPFLLVIFMYKPKAVAACVR